ncbi:MAG: OsmC family protein [Flavobacteriales bacterium]|nr:OsmC family protein [Flavobacteriales bacterium]MCB9447739.1 OsmC family protein [Flavobacteriales bacterium]
MKIELNRLDDAFRFKATSEDGNSIIMDAGPNLGAQGKGVRPMQTLLMGLGGCSGIDIVMILKKQQQQIDDFHMEIEGEREAGKEPSLWKEVHVKFYLDGPLDPQKAWRAVDLSMNKYCSVAKTLEAHAHITFSVFVNNQEVHSEA